MHSLLKKEWKFLLFGFLMTFFSSPGQTYFVSLFSAQIREDLALTDGGFAAVYSAATLVSAVVIIWTGSLVDRVSLVRISLAAILGLAAGCVLMSWASGLVVLAVAVFLLRQMGQGLMCLISSTAMVRYLDRDRGKATALSGMGYAVSEAIMPVLVVALAAWIGWRYSWQLTAGVLVLLVVPMVLLLLRDHDARHTRYMEQNPPHAGNDSSAAGMRHWTRNEVVRDPRFYLFLPAMTAQQLMFTGFIFHQVHLVEVKSWSLPAWASMFAVYAGVSVATKLLVGMLVDRYGAVRLLPLVSLPMGLGLGLLGLTESFYWGAVFLVLTGITVGFSTTVAAPFWAEMYGSRHIGAIKSLATAVMVFATAVSPVAIGLGIDFGIHIETLAWCGAVYMVGASVLAYAACRMPATK